MRTKLIVAAVAVAGLAGGTYVYRHALTPGDPKTSRAASNSTTYLAPNKADADQQAKTFIDNLTKPRAEPITAAKAAHFVTKDQLVLFPLARAGRKTAPPQKVTLDADKPTQVSALGDAIIIEQIALRAVASPDQQRAQTEQLAAVTIGQPAESRVRADPELRSITTMPESVYAATIGQILRQHGKQVNPEDLFYVHTVQDADSQGIWGIIHSGIIQSFGQGLAVRIETKLDTLSVAIPRHADEMLGDRSSSFLGRLIYRKTNQSYVYNFRKQRMGENPDLLRPGQEIVIVTFRPSELISIYKHFVRNSG